MSNFNGKPNNAETYYPVYYEKKISLSQPLTFDILFNIP